MGLDPYENPEMEPDIGSIAKGCLVWVSIWAGGVVVMLIFGHYMWRAVAWLIRLQR